MSEWVVYGKDGLTEKCRLKSVEYSGSFLNERAVSATIENHSKIQFEVFDYIEYRGERFELESIPTVKKTSSFSYEYELRFVSYKYELERCEMRDIVPNDNRVVYPTPLTFSFTGDVRYLVERIQACLDELYGKDVWKLSVADDVVSEEKNITIAQQNCWNALALVNTTYGLNFYIKGRNITIGGSQPILNHTFQYGKGNGLYEIERTSDTDTAIVTKLRAYGSEKNLDYSYPKKPEWSDSALDTSFVLSPLRLMLPSFKKDGKTDYILADEATIAEYGIREASVIYDDIYPTITGAKNLQGQAIDEIKAVEAVDDTKSTFVIHLHDLGFDLESHLTTADAQISMKSGAMQGYTFNISAIEKQNDNSYKITLGRITTDTSDTGNYEIPNSSWNMAAGDKFVLLNILMPQEYIREAENRLLERAKEYLAEYGKTNFSYNVGLHDKFLVENSDVYSSLVEGAKLTIHDEVLGISEDVTIQSITITENAEDNILPQVKITLNNNPSASTLDRIQGQIKELSETASGTFSSQSELLKQYRKKLDKPFFDRLFVAVGLDGKELSSTDTTSPIAYIKAKYSFATIGGITMYAQDGNIYIPTIAEGLPFDGKTIWFNTTTKQIEVIGGTGGGSGEGGVSSFWELNGIPTWITIDKPVYSYSEIINTPDLSVYALKSAIPSLSGYATEQWVLGKGYATTSDLDGRINALINGAPQAYDTLKEIADVLQGNVNSIGDILATLGGKADKATTLGGYGITDAYTQAKVDSLLKGYVTIAGNEDVTGIHNFTNGVKVGGIVLKKSDDGVVYIDGNLVVKGGVTMYGDEKADIPSIYDGLPIDNVTIYWENTSNGKVLKAKVGTEGAITEITSAMVIAALGFTPYDSSNPNGYITSSALNGYATQTWVKNQGYLTQHQDLSGYQPLITSSNKLAYSLVSGTPTSLKNPNALSFGSKSYDGSAKITLSASDLGALTSHQAIYTLTFQSGTFASGSFTANSANKTINIPTTTSHISEGSNLYFTNARAVSALTDTLKAYVTLSGTQTITGEKNFTGGLKVNGSPLVYNKESGYWKLEGDLLVTGGVSMFASDTEFTPSTIMDAIVVDNVTIIKQDGKLVALGGGGTGGGGVADAIAWSNVLGKPAWITDSAPSINVSGVNVSLGGSITQSALRTALGLGSNAYSSTAFLPLTGGTMSTTSSDAITINTSSKDGIGISYKMSDSQVCWIGYDGSRGACLYNSASKTYLSVKDDGSLYYNNGTIIHSGNIGSYNAGSATKLQTARTIWGQSFDGTGNVSGDLYLGSKVIRGNSNLDIINSTGNWVILGHGIAETGYITYVDGNEVQLRYGTSHTTGITLDSGGTTRLARNLVLENDKAVYIKNSSGTGLNILYVDSSNVFHIGYATSGSYNTKICGNNLYLCYGSRSTGLILNSSGNITIGSSDLASTNYKLYVNGVVRLGSNIVMNNGAGFYIQDKTGTNLDSLFVSNSNNFHIGYGIARAGYNTYLDGNKITFRYGTTQYDGMTLNSNGNVGIGISNPSQKFHLKGGIALFEHSAAGGVRIKRTDVNGGAFVDYYPQNQDASFFRFGAFNTSLFGLEYNQVRYYSYDLSGNTFSVQGNILATGGVTMQSARKLKNIHDERGLSLEELKIIKPTRFTWKDNRDEKIHIGGIADDVQKVLPEVIYKTDDDTLTMDYGNAAFAIAASLIKPVINHEQRIKVLEEENEQLKREIEQLKWHIA